MTNYLIERMSPIERVNFECGGRVCCATVIEVQSVDNVIAGPVKYFFLR